MSADLSSIQGWIIIFTIIGGIIAVGTAAWRIINFLRIETKESINEEHKFNVEQHGETRKVVKDALQGVDVKLTEIKTEVAKISDIRVDVAVTKERVASHDNALRYINKSMEDNKS